MKKKSKFILTLGCLSAACLLGACSASTLVDDYKKKGYTVSVIYDANGGQFLSRDGVTIQDMFNPSQYQKDSDGTVHIKLMEPTDENRVGNGSSSVKLTLSDHFFAGWYKNREVVKQNGVPVDNDGRELKQKEDGSYVYASLQDGEKETAVTPAYTYSGYWDFETDTIDYTSSMTEFSMTLYAGWVQYYEFNYYYQQDGEWTKMEEITSFDYKMANATGSTTADKDTIWLPQWSEGAMEYTHDYATKGTYTFPKIEGTTFSKAYFDEACTQEIVGQTEHYGTLNPDYGEDGALKVENRVQNIYVTLEEGEHYRISTAKQLLDNANRKGIYEIQADLDFTGLTWSPTFVYGKFKGQMYSSAGQNYTLSNITAKYSSESSEYGGVFGRIDDGAKLENLTFTNVTFDLAYTGYPKADRYFGLLAGEIEEEAQIANVAVGGTFKIGKITPRGDCSFHLLANGKTTGLTRNEIALQIYGEKKLNEENKYNFSIDPNEADAVTVAADGTVAITFLSSTKYLTQEIYNINTQTNGGN